METPWRRAARQRRSLRSESEGAKSDQGKRVPRSGAGRQKGDIRTSEFLIEDKFTDAHSYTLKCSDLDKITRDAFVSGRLPQMRISMPGHRLRVLREVDYLALMASVPAPDDGALQFPRPPWHQSSY